MLNALAEAAPARAAVTQAVDFLKNVLVTRKAFSTADLSMSASALLNGAPQTNHS